MVLNRESIRNGIVSEILAEGEKLGFFRCWTRQERDASREAALAKRPPGGPVWVFAYGSLIWNPAFEFAEKRRGRLHGHHRAFCLWSPVGRGSPDNPGLLMALKPGGCCNGVAYRLHDGVRRNSELDIIWAREMITGAYIPTWFRIETRDGPVRAISFTINRGYDRYAYNLSDRDSAKAIATAAGRLGPCREYFENTVHALSEMGIVDSRLRKLQTEVDRYGEWDREGAVT